MKLLLLLSRPPDPLEEEEEEEQTDEASDKPSITTVNSDAKYSEDLKSTVAAACSTGCCWCGSPAFNIQKKIRRAERFGVSLQLSDSSNRLQYIFLHFLKIWIWNITLYWVFLLDRCRFDFGFDSILFWVFGFSMKMFVFSIFIFLFFFSPLFWITEITKNIDLNFALPFLILTK